MTMSLALLVFSVGVAALAKTDRERWYARIGLTIGLVLAVFGF